MARGSLGETGDQIDDGCDSGYCTATQRNEMITRVKHACGANSGLRRYLEREQEKRRKSGTTHGPKDL